MRDLDRMIAELEGRAASRDLSAVELAALVSLRTGRACVEVLTAEPRRGPSLDFTRVTRDRWVAEVEGLETVEVLRLPSGMWRVEPCSLLAYREVVELESPYDCRAFLERRLAIHARRAA